MTLIDYINSIKNKSISVIGIGISNEPLINLLLAEGCSVTVRDKRNIDLLGEKALKFIKAGANLKLGDDYLEKLDEEIIFRTPGLMPFEKHLVNAAASGSIITSEMEVFFSLCPCKTIAITGSDGKTTTTTIISELMKAAGYTVHLGGNIGHPLLCEVPFIKKEDIAVLELSSFQLHSMKCSPDIAVITNISPNHLDKHKDYQDYIDAKKNIYLNQKENGILVLNADDDIVSKLGDDRFFSTKKEVNGSWSMDGTVYRFGRKIMDTACIRIPGVHNLKNYLAAFTATEGFADDNICVSVAESFKGVEHRLETVRTVKGVTYINDSIGSSPSRTIAGLHSLKKKPIIIVGGYDKLIPFEDLGDELCKYAKAVFITGATKEKINHAVKTSKFYLPDKLHVTVIEDFTEAVVSASNYADAGDIVLLSPACASFDRFDNFEERGNFFKKIIMEL